MEFEKFVLKVEKLSLFIIDGVFGGGFGGGERWMSLLVNLN